MRPDPHEVKQLVARTFLDLGAFSPRLLDLKETIFVNGDTCIAHAYRAADLKAVWSVEDGTVEFCDAEGHLLRVVKLLGETVPQSIVTQSEVG